jgi:hypothetical protein
MKSGLPALKESAHAPARRNQSARSFSNSGSSKSRKRLLRFTWRKTHKRGVDNAMSLQVLQTCSRRRGALARLGPFFAVLLVSAGRQWRNIFEVISWGRVRTG